MRGSKFPADKHNYISCPIYIPSFMIIGAVVSEELRWQDFGTDGQTDRQTDGWSDCTPRPAFAFGDAGKNVHDTLTGCWVIPIFNKIWNFPRYLWNPDVGSKHVGLAASKNIQHFFFK